MHVHYRWLAAAVSAAVMGLMTGTAMADPELTPTPAQHSHDAHSSSGTTTGKTAAAPQSVKQPDTVQKHSEQPPAPPKDKTRK